MIFLPPLLLSITSNLDTISISSSYGIKKIHLPKSIALLLAIITSIGTLISMYIGKLILALFQPVLANIFGAVLLSFIGVYFIVEYIRLEQKHDGYDTSNWFNSTLKYINVLENPNIIDSNKSSYIDIKKFFNISLALTLNNFYIYFAASITGVNISLSIFFNFLITIISVYLGYYYFKVSISKWFIKYSNLFSGIILIILGICEAFI